MISARARNSTIFALVAVAGFSAVAFSYYREKLSANVEWDNKVSIEQETRLDSSIFRIAQARGLIRTRQGPSGELLLIAPACEGMILGDDEIKTSTGQPSATAEEMRNYRTALRLLCTSPQGEEIRNEIEAWNAAYDLLGVRDNRFQDDTCQSKREGLKADVFVPRDCKPNSWKVERVLASSRVATSWIPGAEPPPVDFSMIADARSAYAGDWAMLKSAEPDGSDRPRYRMYSEKIELPPNREVTIDVVGRLRGVRVYDANLGEKDIEKIPMLAVDPAKPETPESGSLLGPARVAIFIQCGEESEFETNGRKAGEKQARLQSAGQPKKSDSKQDDYDDEDSSGDDECEAEPGYGSRIPISYQVTLLGQVGRNARLQELIVEIDAESVQLLPVGLRKDWSRAAEQEPNSRQQVVVRLTRHIEAVCPLDFRKREGACLLSWERVPGAQRSKPPKFGIVAHVKPDRNLVDENSGIIKSDAFDEGFAPMIGLGPQDWGSLAFALAHRPAASGGSEPEQVQLTIDPDLQIVARDAIESGVQGNCQPAPRTKKSRSPRARRGNCLLLRSDQTATFVVLDADKRPGEIKALTSWPRLSKHLHLWDLQALESAGAGMAAGAWRLVVPDQRPGSTFKAITAMTAIDLATGSSVQTQGLRDKLQILLKGQMPIADQRAFLRLTSARWLPGARRNAKQCVIDSRTETNAIPVPDDQNPRWCAHNFQGRGGPAAYWQAKIPTKQTCPRAFERSANPQFGMCEALMVSSNLFFGGLAEQITRRAPHRADDPLALETMARRLSYDDQPCLDSRGAPVHDKDGDPKPCGFDLLRRMDGVRAAKLIADPPVFDLEDYDDATDLQKLLRTGWGDGASATPLAMASVYASLGRERLVRPSIRYVDRTSDGCPKNPEQDECKELLPDWNRARSLFENLRAGLHAVSGPGGSGAGAFEGAEALRLAPGGKPRLFVKTGTATYRAVNGKTGDASNYFSLWLAGWIDGVEGTPIRERLAFACVITRGLNNETGGGTCARLVRRFLESLNRPGQRR